MKSKLLILIVLLALGGGALFSACTNDEDAPGGVRRGFKFDAQSQRLLIQMEGVNQVSYPIQKAHTASVTLTLKEVGSINTNTGSTGNVTLTLPNSAAAGAHFTFVVTKTTSLSFLKIDANSGGAIYLDGTKGTDDQVIRANDEGESINLIADGNGDWIAYGAEDVGNWGTASS